MRKRSFSVRDYAQTLIDEHRIRHRIVQLRTSLARTALFASPDENTIALEASRIVSRHSNSVDGHFHGEAFVSNSDAPEQYPGRELIDVWRLDSLLLCTTK